MRRRYEWRGELGGAWRIMVRNGGDASTNRHRWSTCSHHRSTHGHHRSTINDHRSTTSRRQSTNARRPPRPKDTQALWVVGGKCGICPKNKVPGIRARDLACCLRSRA